MKKNCEKMGMYLVSILSALLAFCGVVSADNTAYVGAESLQTIELDMPDITSWTLTIGDNTKTTNFAARGNVDFDIYAKEDGGDGKLQSGSTPMQNPIEIVTWDYDKFLSGTNQQIAGVISSGPHSWPNLIFALGYKQQLTYDDPAGSYSMTIAYTGQKHV